MRCSAQHIRRALSTFQGRRGSWICCIRRIRRVDLRKDRGGDLHRRHTHRPPATSASDHGFVNDDKRKNWPPNTGFHNSPRPDSSRSRNCCSRDRVRRTCLKNLSSSTRHPPSIPARQRNPIIPSECREKKKHWHRPLLAQARSFLECSHPQKARIQGEASRRRGFCSGAQSPPRPRHRIYLKQDAV